MMNSGKVKEVEILSDGIICLTQPHPQKWLEHQVFLILLGNIIGQSAMLI